MARDKLSPDPRVSSRARHCPPHTEWLLVQAPPFWRRCVPAWGLRIWLCRLPCPNPGSTMLGSGIELPSSTPPLEPGPLAAPNASWRRWFSFFSNVFSVPPKWLYFEPAGQGKDFQGNHLLCASPCRPIPDPSAEPGACACQPSAPSSERLVASGMGISDRHLQPLGSSAAASWVQEDDFEG